MSSIPRRGCLNRCAAWVSISNGSSSSSRPGSNRSSSTGGVYYKRLHKCRRHAQETNASRHGGLLATNRQTRGNGGQGWLQFCIVILLGRPPSRLRALGFLDEFVEHLSHQGRVPAHDRGGCCDVAVGVEVLPVEDEAGLAGELFEEGVLGPAVALAERADGVDLTQVVLNGVIHRAGQGCSAAGGCARLVRRPT